MARIPIRFQKFNSKEYNNRETVKYFVIIEEKDSHFDKIAVCDRAELIKLRNTLDEILADSNTAEILNITEENAKIIDNAHQTDKLCKDCELKMTQACVSCLLQLESPLERILFLELKRAKIYFHPQYPLNWFGEKISTYGKSYNNPQNNFKEVLTIVDFYIEKNGAKLCVYTDGHTYHERTEEQAQHDRNIDRKLQELGYVVLRYTGKDVTENSSKIINEIIKWVNNN